MAHKTLKKTLLEMLDEDFNGHPSREDEHDIRQLKKAILILADAIDKHRLMGHE